MLRKTVAAALLIAAVTVTAYGAGRYQEAKVLLTDDVKITVDGKQTALTETDGSAIVPINYNGRIYLPVRAVADLVNCGVEWNGTTKTVLLSPGNGIADEEEAGYASLTAVAYMTGNALKSKDYTALADLAHPEKGIRFSINGMVEPEHDVVLKKSDLLSSGIGSRKLTWGVENESPEPLVKSVDEFMARFARDFENPKRNSWNERTTGLGIKEQPAAGVKTIDGGEAVYASSEFAEYYFEGSSGLEFDWESFLMIYEKYNGAYCLVGVVHNYWLI